MLKTNLIMIPLLMTFIACDEDLVFCDVSFKYARCKCVCISTKNMQTTLDENCEWHDGSKFVSGNYNLKRCDGFIGLHLSDYSKKAKPLHKKLMKKLRDLKYEADQCRFLSQ